MDEIKRCLCGQRYRVRAAIAEEPLICPTCKRAVPCPSILRRLEGVRDELIRLDQQFSYFGGPARVSELNRSLSTQEKILRQMEVQYRGYRQTTRVAFDLCIEIQVRIEAFRGKLKLNVFSVAVRILTEMLSIFKDQGPKAITRGMYGPY